MIRAVILVLFVMLSACKEQSLDVGDGYKYVQLDGRNWTIANKDNIMIVDPNVTKCKAIGALIVGYRNDSGIDERLSKKYGFFVFDKRSGVLVEGLDKGGFESALQAHGVPANSLD